MSDFNANPMPDESDRAEQSLRKIALSLFGGGVSRFTQTFTYYASTNNVHTVTYKNPDGSTFKTLTFTYVNGAAANDDLVASITPS